MVDIIIIGSGIIGSSIARELSRYNASILVLEKESDISSGTTKANSGIVHAGFDNVPNTLKAKFNVEGNSMFEKISMELDFPFIRNGAFVIAYDKDSELQLEELYHRGIVNGVKDLEIITGKEARLMEHNLSNQVSKALFAPSSGVVSPYEMAIGYAENAALNGVKFIFNEEVIDILKIDEGFKVVTDNNNYQARVIINCAGVNADDLNNIINDKKMDIVARKGEYLLLDKDGALNISRTIFQTPTKMGKGVLVTPATHGNIIIGPTAVDIEEKHNLASTISGLKEVWEKASRIIPSLNKKAIITAFTGLRAHSLDNDFIIGFNIPGFYNVAGIESPGLTSAPAIASFVATEIADYLHLPTNESFKPNREGITQFSKLSDEEKQDILKKDNNYGKIICRCEVVSEAEIIDAINRPLGARDLDGIKRRTRAGMGRCQGGFCTPRVMEILARNLNIDITDITKHGRKSNIVIGRVKK